MRSRLVPLVGVASPAGVASAPVLAVALVVVVALTGCAAHPAPAAAVPVAVVEPAVDTTNWAADAHAAYDRYLSGVNAAAHVQAGQGRHTVGDAVARDFTVQSVDATRHTMTAYICLDLSHSRLVDDAGRTVVLPNRRSGTLVVTFSFTGTAVHITGSDTWSGASVC